MISAHMNIIRDATENLENFCDFGFEFELSSPPLLLLSFVVEAVFDPPFVLSLFDFVLLVVVLLLSSPPPSLCT